jgi:hypothetical protein
MAGNGVVSQDVRRVIVTPNLKVAMRRIEPAVHYRAHLDVAPTQVKAPWFLLAAVAGVAFDPHLKRRRAHGSAIRSIAIKGASIQV